MAVYTIPLEITLDEELDTAELGRRLCVAVEEALDDHLEWPHAVVTRVVALHPHEGVYRHLSTSKA